MKNNSYDNHITALKNGNASNFYVYHGEERYLLERCLVSLRALLCPDGLDGFNYKRYEGKDLSADEFETSVNTMPFFAERTLIEVHDFDIFKADIRERLLDVFNDLPDYVCIVIVYSTIEYKPDGRQKLNKEIIKNAEVVEFVVQEQDKLVKWIRRHFHDAGKKISIEDAEYLAFITGGFMATLNGEIEKTAAYAKLETITRKDIDDVVTPILDTVAYKLTDALVSRENVKALQILDELFQMREAPHKLMFSISLKMRKLLAARICIENNQSRTSLMEICGIRHDFQARTLMNTATRTTLQKSREAVLSCSKTALELNSSQDPESRLIELVLDLANRTSGKIN